MAKFCGKCGAKLDEATGLCPNCDADELKRLQEVAAGTSDNSDDKEAAQQEPSNKPLSKKAAKKQKKADKKAAKKAKKKAKRAAMTTGQKIRRFFLKLIAVLLVLAILAVGVIGVLVYFGLVDIPVASELLEQLEIISPKATDTNTGSSLYTPDEDSLSLDEDSGVVYVNNIIIIFFNEGTSQQDIDEIVMSIEGEVVGSLPIIDQYQIKVEPHTLQELVEICDTLKELDCVYDAIYDEAFQIQSDAVPDDPWTKTWFNKGETWSETNPNGANWWLEAVEAISAWDYDANYDEIKIGIVDNGFDDGHEDLKNVIAYTSPINNKSEHGTHVAGIIGAEANNNKGITGLVWNCQLYTYDWELSTSQKIVDYVFDMQWSTFNQILGGTVNLIGQGAKVVNLSAGQTAAMSGTTRSKSDVDYNGYNASLYLHALLSRGYDFLIVQSAGNGNANNVSVDAIYNGLFCSITTENCVTSPDISADDIIGRVVVVGAAQNDGNGSFSQPYWSNAGERVDICAPGVDIYSTVPGGWSGKYQYSSGTSMAAPIVSGIASLVWSANPELSGADVKKIICNEENTKYVVSDNTSANHPLTNSYNLINAKLSVETAINYVPDAQTPETEGQFDPSDIPSGAAEFNGHYYYVYDIDTVTTWEEAKEYCESQGGYLATITSQEEDEFVYAYLRNNFDYESAYFGFTDRDEEGNWVWDNSEVSSYTNWHSGEPNSENPNEDFAMYYYKYLDGSWNDGDFGNRTVNSGRVFICEWGEYQTASNSQSQEPVRTTSDERDIVLVLDTSGSMSGTPMEETKKAATNFVNTILEEDASIGIVTYEDSAERLSDFSVDKNHLTGIVAGISSGGGTNIESGLAEAKSMLDSSNAKKKIIVLMSDGEPNEGKEGEELIAYADEIKNSDILIYTLGFFENMGGSKSSAQYLMEHLASEGCHYEVASAGDLVFFFEDMADQINGQKYIYIRIACPVDVTVTYNGETLCSAEDDLNVRTDFGTLTFEDSENETSVNEDDRIKVLRLKEGADYDVQIVGTGRGMMDYTIGFMDENGDYSDFRRFENVKITKQTVINTVAAVSDESVLNIDEDGDGKYDLKLRAEENGYGEEIKTPVWFYLGIGGGTVLLIIAVLVVVKIRKSKKKGMVKS